jgi:hypothetical protein
MTDVEKLLRRAQRGPEHAKESRKLCAGVHAKREEIDPGFTDERIPGTCLEFVLPAGVDPMLVPMQSPWIALTSTLPRDTNAMLNRSYRPSYTQPFAVVRYLLAWCWARIAGA